MAIGPACRRGQQKTRVCYCRLARIDGSGVVEILRLSMNMA